MSKVNIDKAKEVLKEWFKEEANIEFLFGENKKLKAQLEVAIDSLIYIMATTDYGNLGTAQLISELANERLLDISECKSALKKIEELGK